MGHKHYEEGKHRGHTPPPPAEAAAATGNGGAEAQPSSVMSSSGGAVGGGAAGGQDPFHARVPEAEVTRVLEALAKDPRSSGAIPAGEDPPLFVRALLEAVLATRHVDLTGESTQGPRVQRVQRPAASHSPNGRT